MSYRQATRAALVLVTLMLLGCGDDTAEECQALADDLVDAIKKGCPPKWLACDGNPDLDDPKMTYTKQVYDLEVKLRTAGCEMPDLGSAPVFCNVGKPQCPLGYTCDVNTCKRQ
jgi:hypothetical protein